MRQPCRTRRVLGVVAAVLLAGLPGGCASLNDTSLPPAQMVMSPYMPPTSAASRAEAFNHGSSSPAPAAASPFAASPAAWSASADDRDAARPVAHGQETSGPGGYRLGRMPGDTDIVRSQGGGSTPGLPDPIALPSSASPAPPPGPMFVPAGYGVNALPTTVYQSPFGGGAMPANQPPFLPQSPVLEPDEYKDIDVILPETQTGRLILGFGVNSDAGLVGNFVLDEQNFDLFQPSFRPIDWINGRAFRGGGQKLRIEAMPGTEVQRYSFNFQEPYLFDSPISFGVSAFYFDRDYTSWDEQRAGGLLTLGYVFPERRDLSISGSIGAQSVKISNPAVPTPPELEEVVGNNDLYTARMQLAHDTRDSAFLPTQGHYISLAFEQGFGSFSFPQFEVDGRQYFVMRERADRSGRHILGLAGKVGVAGSDTPLFEHFFAGGFSTIRGFEFRGASPQDMGVIVGGEFEILTSIEYRFPLTQNDMLYGSFFCDAGTVERDARIKGSNFRVSPGFELRFNIPALGPIPIAIGVASPIQHAPGDQIQNIFFFLGVSR